MTPGMHRLLIGGIGGLAPVFALLVAVDFEANLVNASTGKIAGYAVRALALFMIGGFVAWLHEKEHEPFKLFELGMGGPALLAGLITSNSIVASAPVKPAGPGIASLLVPAAHAQVTVHAPTARFGEPIRIAWATSSYPNRRRHVSADDEAFLSELRMPPSERSLAPEWKLPSSR